MIFVTVGTHEQPFNRLILYIDGLKKEGIIEEEVVFQTGFSDYEPQYCRWSHFFPQQKMKTFIKEAHIVITHGGSASICTLLEDGVIPIVVPRQRRFKEHVNDHQVEFCQAISDQNWGIIPVYEIEKITDILIDYDKLSSRLRVERKSNTLVFNEKLKEIVNNFLNL